MDTNNKSGGRSDPANNAPRGKKAARGNHGRRGKMNMTGRGMHKRLLSGKKGVSGGPFVHHHGTAGNQHQASTGKNTIGHSLAGADDMGSESSMNLMADDPSIKTGSSTPSKPSGLHKLVAQAVHSATKRQPGVPHRQAPTKRKVAPSPVDRTAAKAQNLAKAHGQAQNKASPVTAEQQRDKKVAVHSQSSNSIISPQLPSNREAIKDVHARQSQKRDTGMQQNVTQIESLQQQDPFTACSSARQSTIDGQKLLSTQNSKCTSSHNTYYPEQINSNEIQTTKQNEIRTIPAHVLEPPTPSSPSHSLLSKTSDVNQTISKASSSHETPMEPSTTLNLTARAEGNASTAPSAFEGNCGERPSLSAVVPNKTSSQGTDTDIDSRKETSQCRPQNTWGPTFGLDASRPNSAPQLEQSDSLPMTSPLNSWYLSKGQPNFARTLKSPLSLQQSKSTWSTVVMPKKRRLLDAGRQLQDADSELYKELARRNWRLWYGTVNPEELLDPDLPSIHSGQIHEGVDDTNTIPTHQELLDELMPALDSHQVNPEGHTKPAWQTKIEESIRLERLRQRKLDQYLLTALQDS